MISCKKYFRPQKHILISSALLFPMSSCLQNFIRSKMTNQTSESHACTMNVLGLLRSLLLTDHIRLALFLFHPFEFIQNINCTSWPDASTVVKHRQKQEIGSSWCSVLQSHSYPPMGAVSPPALQSEVQLILQLCLFIFF